MEKEVLNRELSIPLHYQLMVILKKRVEDGVYPVDSKIPNEMELCEEFQVSRPTVRKAVGELVEAGMLMKVHPKGTFVCRHGEKKMPLPPENNVEKEASPAASRDTLTVSLESPLMDLLLYQAVEEYEYHTGTHISIQPKGPWQNGFSDVVNAIIEDKVPDVFLVSNVAVSTFAQMGIIAPFDSFLGEERLASIRRTEGGAPNPYFYQGALFGYPFFSETRLMYYRKDYFEEEGLPYPSKGWTHEDFLALCRRLTHPERNRWGYAFPDSLDGDTLQTLMTWIMQRGGEIYRMRGRRVEPATDEPQFAEAFQWVCDLVLRHRVCPSTEKSENYLSICTRFLDGEIAMMIGLPSLSLILDSRLPGRWGVCELPMGSAHNHPYRGGMPLCMSSKCKNPQLAYDFIRYLTSRPVLFPFAKRVGVLPPLELYSREEILSGTSPELTPFALALPESVSWDRFGVHGSEESEMEVWQMPLQHTLRRVLKGQLSCEYAVKYISLSIRNILKKSVL